MKARTSITIFIPSVDSSGKPINHRYWVDKVLTFLTDLFGGATATPGKGAWKDENSGIVFDNTTSITSFAKPFDVKTHKKTLFEYTKQLKHSMKQSEVGLLINNHYYGV